MTDLLGPERGYVDILMDNITARLEKERDEGKTYSKTPIRPSSAGNCARELYYSLMHYTGRAKYDLEVREPEADLLLDLGHYIESHLIRKIRANFSSAEVRYTQQVLDFGFIEAVNDAKLSQHLEGSMDLALWSDEFKVAIDVKSKGDNYNYKARMQNWEATSEKLDQMRSVQTLSDRAFWVPDLDAFLEERDEAGELYIDPFFAANFLQLNLYCNSDFLKSRGVNHGAIIQYQKNKSLLREVRFRPSHRQYVKVVTKMRNVVTAVDTSNIDLAPREHEEGSMKCRYCPFQKECWGHKATTWRRSK